MVTEIEALTEENEFLRNEIENLKEQLSHFKAAVHAQQKGAYAEVSQDRGSH